jgi:hypothetical protein
MNHSRASIALLLCGAACAPADSPQTATRQDSSGIEIVTNTATDWPLREHEQVTRTLGEALALASAAGQVSVASDRDSVLYVLDERDARLLRVRVTDGQTVQVAGKGDGPGELRFPVSLTMDSLGVLSVMDLGRQQVQPFAPDGTPLDPTPTADISTGLFDLAHTTHGTLLEADVRTEQGRFRHLLVARPGDTTEIAATAPRPPGSVFYQTCGISMSATPLFTSWIRWRASRSGVAVVTGSEYEVRLYDGPRLRRIIRRKIPPRPATRALALQELGEGMVINVGNEKDCRIPPQEMLDQQGVADVIPAIDMVYLGDDQSLWVKRKVVKGEPELIDLFDSTGAYIGTETGDHLFPQTAGPNGTLVTVTSDSLDLASVVLFRMERD